MGAWVCFSANAETYTITAVKDTPGPDFKPGSLQLVTLSRGYLTPVEAFRYPDSQCDAAMTVCTPVNPVRERDAAAIQ